MGSHALRRGALGLSLALVACCLPLGSMGKTILVTNAGDEGSCPGANCTLLAAWRSADLNDTIVLNTSVTLFQTLQRVFPSTPNSDYYSTITIEAARPGFSVTQGTPTNSFLGVVLNQRKINIVIQGFTIGGFRLTNKALICVDQGTSTGDCGRSLATEEASMAKANSASAHPARPRQTTEAQRRLWEAKGEAPQPNPVLLRLSEMEISNHYYSTVQNIGMIYTACYYDCSAVFSDVVLKGNTIEYTDNLYGVLYDNDYYLSLTPATSLYVSSVQVLGNNVTNPMQSVSEVDALIRYNGDIYAKNLEVASNSMGQGLGVLSTGPDTNDEYTEDLFMEDSTFYSNAIFSASSAGTWTIKASHAHLKRVVIESAAPRAISTINDQYLSACTLTTKGGATPLLKGWEFFNRDPYHTLGSSDTTLGFANCTSASDWLPCPATAPMCTTITNMGSTVGYSCN